MTKTVNIVIPGLTLLFGILLGMVLSKAFSKTREGFDSTAELTAKCRSCSRPSPCNCPAPRPICPPCPPCARCPEPAFDCKKVPNYNAFNQSFMPVPV